MPTQDLIDLNSLSASPALSIVRCDNPEQVANVLPGTKRRLLPFTGEFDFQQASLQIGHTGLVIVKRPPCISEGYLEQSRIGIALSMCDSPGLKLDGSSLERPVLVTHGLGTPHRIFQPSELTIGAIYLPSTSADRGWPDRTLTTRVDPVRPQPLLQLRSIINDLVCLASHDPARFSHQTVVSGMEQSLLGSIDSAFLTATNEQPAGLAIGKYVRVCRLANEFIESHARDLPTSADVAEAAGVTIRTLHNAMVAVHGVSLQKFMILNRLWAARAALLRGGSRKMVKTIAFDHGFWHLGRFSRTYHSFFGELPSQTLMQKRSA